MEKESFTKYEIARILGARALQLSMNAPILVTISKEKLEEINFDPLKIADIEFNSGVLPITVKRPLPERLEGEYEEEDIDILEEVAEEVPKKGKSVEKESSELESKRTAEETK